MKISYHENVYIIRVMIESVMYRQKQHILTSTNYISIYYYISRYYYYNKIQVTEFLRFTVHVYKMIEKLEKRRYRKLEYPDRSLQIMVEFLLEIQEVLGVI